MANRDPLLKRSKTSLSIVLKNAEDTGLCFLVIENIMMLPANTKSSSVQVHKFRLTKVPEKKELVSFKRSTEPYWPCFRAQF